MVNSRTRKEPVPVLSLIRVHSTPSHSHNLQFIRLCLVKKILLSFKLAAKYFATSFLIVMTLLVNS
jgi:hypothetical protein